MNRLDLYCLLFAIICGIILYFVMRCRIHIHVTYTPLRGREPRRKGDASRTGTAFHSNRFTAGDDRPLQIPTAQSSGAEGSRGRRTPHTRAAAGSPEPGYSAPPKPAAVRPYAQVDPREATGKLGSRSTNPSTPRVLEIQSALVNLGCKPTRALKIAAAVCQEPAEFDTQLRHAIQEARKAA